MAWIEAHQSLADHPKVIMASEILDISEAQVIGHLMFLWWWALDRAPDGNLSAFGPRIVERAARWQGAHGAFHAALVTVRLLDEDGAIHDWHEYAGRLLDKRAANAQRAQESRERARNVRATNTHVAGLPTQPTQPTEPTQPRQTEHSPNGNGAAAAFDQVEHAHGLYVGNRISKDQALAYEKWLTVTTPTAIIDALAEAKTNNAERPHAYAMSILKRKQSAGELPRNGPIVADFDAPLEVDASWM